jgi:riboflavin synthase
VALIPHTLAATIAGEYRKGSRVNLEADIVARYVARNLRR